jgi:hypothetical protein
MSTDPLAGMMRATQFRLALGLATALVLTAAALGAGRAEINLAQEDSLAPLPPQRPAALSPARPAPPAGQPLPDSTSAASIVPSLPAAPQSPDEPIKTGAFNEGPGTMLRLPPASHARMHQCAAEWQNMKLTGAAEEKIWFNFALRCLTR